MTGGKAEEQEVTDAKGHHKEEGRGARVPSRPRQGEHLVGGSFPQAAAGFAAAVRRRR